MDSQRKINRAIKAYDRKVKARVTLGEAEEKYDKAIQKLNSDEILEVLDHVRNRDIEENVDANSD